LDELFKVNENVIVVLSGGAPVEIPWFDKAKAVLLSYLAGEGGGKAVSNILCGRFNPTGRLAETWPLKLEDNPSYANFPGNSKEVFYKEGIFIGYRHYDSKNIPLRFPFGYGLSYGKTCFKDLKCDNEIYSYTNEKTDNDDLSPAINLSFCIKNESDKTLTETAFIFVGHESKFVKLPKKELRNFIKADLKPGEERQVTVSIPVSELGYYNTELKMRYVETGKYTIYICKNVNDVILTKDIEIRLKEGELNNYFPTSAADDYDAFFASKKYREVAVFKRPFTMENCFSDVKSTFMGRLVYKQVMKRVAGEGVDKEQIKMIEAMMNEMPFYALTQAASAQVGEGTIEGMLDIINLKFFKGLKKIWAKS
ncbi:MAG: glycoside hydrolase family 3 C-terminal domain-containing protein, partial [Parasporobacterium sp.]|nr:glycoside hydrolase family 3 C-terminal domain-containing protein [Parasporobacterium sp.]